MYRSLILILTILLVHKAQAQIAYNDSKKLLTDGVALYEKGEYKKSLELYRQVDESDTNYASAVYEEVLSLQADSSFEDAKTLALSGLHLPKADRRAFLLALGATYDYLQKQDSALIIYDSVMKLYPNDNQPWYEEGVLYFRKKLYDKALAYFHQSMIINPTHFKSHYMTGIVYAIQGRLSEAMIAFQASLLMTSNAAVAKQSISLINSIADETDEAVSLYHAKAEQYSDPLFDETDQLVNAKIALNKDYKLKMSINDNIFRQLQVVMEKLKYDPDDTNFVMQFYVPLLTKIYNEDMFEPYLLLLFSDYGFENVDKLAKTNSKEVAAVKAIVFPYLYKIQATREINYKKRETAPELYHYYPNDNVIIIGTSVAKGDDKIITGDAVFLRSNHTLKSKGRYNTNGEKEGWWISYFGTGGIASKTFYVKDQEHDSSYTYYLNGNLDKVSLRDKEGNVTAEYEYDYGGWLSAFRKKLSDKSIEEVSYYPNGQKELDMKYDGNTTKDGTYTLYHSNGKVKKQFTIADGKYSGTVKLYYDDGNLSEVTTYTKGTFDGPYEDHYESGAIKEKYNNDNGKADGPYEEYYKDGKVEEKGVYKKGSKQQTTKYSEDGKIYGTLDLDGNIPVHVKYMDEDGKVVFDKEDKKGLYDYQLYYSNGNKAVDMKIGEKGSRNGFLTFYYNTGAKSEETNYKDGNLEGTSVSYYKDGKIKSEENYVNDKKDGYFKWYFYNGKVSQEGWYKDGKRQGLWRFYYANGKLENEKYFLDDNYSGTYKEYNINGEVTDKYVYDYGLPISHVTYDTTGAKTDSVSLSQRNGTYKFNHWQNKPGYTDLEYGIKYGKFEGPCIHRYVNGAVREQNYFKESNKDSLNIAYFPDGVVRNRGSFSKGNKVGKWEYFNEAAELTCEENYNKSGSLEGSRKVYSCNELRIDYNNKDGNKDGKQVYYGENGKTAFILFYDEGDLTGYTYEGKDGKLLPEIKVKNGTVKMTAYYSNGQKSGEADFEQNIVKGKLNIYYSNGQLAEERSYKNFDLDGPFKRYSPDGKLLYDISYTDDQEMGVERYFNKDGKLIVATSYYYGWHHGPTTVTDPVTNKTKTYYYHYGQLTGVKND